VNDALPILAFFVTQVVGPNLSRASAINGYHEFYNGSVTQAWIAPDVCHRDGSCQHHYTCDHEQIDHPATYDSKGNMTSPPWTEDIYHQCPYTKRELAYVLDTNIGKTVVIARGYFDAHPQAWRDSRDVPDDVPRQPPVRWLKARDDLARGLSDPVTGVFLYANYILASDSNLYKDYDGSIKRYKQAGMIPSHTGNRGGDMLYDYGMRADKVQVVGGLRLSNLSTWQDRLMRFNAALGSTLQGDMHIVLVPANKVSDPDEYITALKASWTRLGKWSISKNGIILVLGASPDGKTVIWSRAATGMPYGNGEMLEALKLQLNPMPLDPTVLLGQVTANVRQVGDKLEVKYDPTSSGAIGQIVFTKFPFARACMKCTSKGDKGTGYVDLKDLVPITTGAKILMFCIVLFLSLLFWAAMAMFDPFNAIIPSGSNPQWLKQRKPFSRY
jgi:hypothetical protein